MIQKAPSISYNGNIIHNDSSATVFLNRALRLGDGFFETIRVMDGVPHAWEAHYTRIKACCKALSLVAQPHMDEGFLLRSIAALLSIEGVENARLRITFFRQGEGAYKPESNRLGFIAEFNPLDEGAFQVKDEGLQVGLYTLLYKHRGALSAYKLLGNHVYIQAAIWAGQNHFQEALLCNDAGDIIEAASSNLFIVEKGALVTPPVASGCVGGVMRMAVINAALDAGMPCYESVLDEKDILEASEVFLTNAIRGIGWVRSFRDRRYFHKVSDMLIAKINDRHEAMRSEVLKD